MPSFTPTTPKRFTVGLNAGIETFPVTEPVPVSVLTSPLPLKVECSGSVIAWPIFLSVSDPERTQLLYSAFCTGGT